MFTVTVKSQNVKLLKTIKNKNCAMTNDKYHIRVKKIIKYIMFVPKYIIKLFEIHHDHQIWQVIKRNAPKPSIE